MANYSDVGSKQQRYCGKITPKEYVSNTNVLIIEMKTNSDSIRGKGFRLRWEAVSGKYKCFEIVVSLKMRLSHSVMIYILKSAYQNGQRFVRMHLLNRT